MNSSSKKTMHYTEEYKDDPEILEWIKMVIMKDEYYDVIEDLDLSDITDKLKERSA